MAKYRVIPTANEKGKINGYAPAYGYGTNIRIANSPRFKKKSTAINYVKKLNKK